MPRRPRFLPIVSSTVLAKALIKRATGVQVGTPFAFCAESGLEHAVQCLCNGLVANIGLGQIRPGSYREPPILTSGEDLSVLAPYLRVDRTHYSAADVVHRLCDDPATAQEASLP